MKCLLCNNELVDMFYNNYTVSACENCKTFQLPFEKFKKFLTYQINVLIKEIDIKNMIFEDLKNSLFHIESADLKLTNTIYKQCAKTDCSSKIKDCTICQYNFNKFIFYYCFYSNIIIFTEADLLTFIKYLYKLYKFQKFKNKVNLILKKIKALFIKE